MRNTPSLTDYRIVRALTDQGAFRAAAETLGMSPSALSRQLAALESQLDVRLFDRDTRNVAPTASGEAFARLAERMLNTAEDVMEEFGAHLSASRGRLTIAGLPSVTAGLLPGLLKSFAATHPGIDLRIVDALSGNVIEAIEAGRADIGFTAGTVSARMRLAFHPLLDDHFVAVGAPDGPLMEERSYTLSELTAMPVIAMEVGTSVRELLDGACQRGGLALTPRFEVAHLATAGALVAEGLGITILPTLTLPVLPMERLVQRPVGNFGAKRRIGLVYQAGRSISPTARAFLEHTRQNLRGISKPGRGFSD
ncbi:LysR family transcriptional regulator [Vannielia litorea]|uniref:LysR family transcriptional regulator n=1 Tax=Vannielia litorea TaxID=1217970 RepID=UPI001BCE0C88|nr:LysR family transcriptional regulator [Vannielia litorea]MBS8226371.1 LysR family transcriptional regulator [Vannielia litorea]